MRKTKTVQKSYQETIYSCPKCWEAGAEIRGKIEEVRRIATVKEDKLWKQWRSIVKEVKNDK